jgi:hypothetical protein
MASVLIFRNPHRFPLALRAPFKRYAIHKERRHRRIAISRLEFQEKVCTGLVRIKFDYLRESAACHSLPLFWLSLCSPVIAELTHFIFPALRPDVQPTVAASVQAVVGHGRLMQDLPNFWVHVTGRYYFPGMYTAILPMVPGIYGIRKLLTAAKRSSRSRNR